MKSPKSKVVQAEPVLLKLLRDPNRFKKLEDGWVKDNLLGVDWSPSSQETMTLKQAKSYCKKLKARLPEVQELQSIFDCRKYNPAINTDIFADAKSSWYWTGTEYAGNSSYAWIVGFYNGYVNYCSEDHSSFVRAVRPSQCN